MDDNKRRNLLIYLALLIIVLTAFDLTLVYNRDHVYKKSNNTENNNSNTNKDKQVSYPTVSAVCEQTGGSGFDTDSCKIGSYSFNNDFLYERKNTTFTVTNGDGYEITKGDSIVVGDKVSSSYAYNIDGSINAITGFDKTNGCYSYDRYSYDGTKLNTNYCVIGIDDNYIFTSENNHIYLRTYNEEKISNFDIDLSDGNYKILHLGWDVYDSTNCKNNIIALIQNNNLKDGEEGVKVVYSFDPSTGKTDKKLLSSLSDYNGSVCNYHK